MNYRSNSQGAGQAFSNGSAAPYPGKSGWDIRPVTHGDFAQGLTPR